MTGQCLAYHAITKHKRCSIGYTYAQPEGRLTKSCGIWADQLKFIKYIYATDIPKLCGLLNYLDSNWLFYPKVYWNIWLNPDSLGFHMHGLGVILNYNSKTVGTQLFPRLSLLYKLFLLMLLFIALVHESYFGK